MKPGRRVCHVLQARDHRSEEHTSELQSRPHLVCRLLLEKKKNNRTNNHYPAEYRTGSRGCTSPLFCMLNQVEPMCACLSVFPVVLCRALLVQLVLSV